MSRFLLAGFLLSFPGIAFNRDASAGAPSRATDPPLTVRVRLYDYAGLSEETIDEAQEVTSFVFRQAGIKIVWLPCPTANSTDALGSPCDLPRDLTDLVIRVLPREMVERVKDFRGYFGFAWPAAEGHFASVASVFHHEIAALARDEGYPEAVLLGHLIAHEMGHLLLGLGSHSLKGLMRHPWSRPELDQAARGTLRFTTEQCRRIREDLQARRQKALEVLKLATEAP